MKSPAFQFYPTDWLGSQRCQMLSLEEEGAYIRLLCYCWQHGSVPADPQQAARLIGKGGSTTLATVVLAMFQPSSDPTRLVHDRLESEREKQAVWREKSAAGGRKSAEKRKGGSTTLQPPLVGSLENGTNQKATLRLLSPSPSSNNTDTGWQEREAKALPESLRTPDVVAAWTDWIIFWSQNRGNGKPMPEQTAREHCLILRDLGAEGAVSAIRHSIASNYAKPYPAPIGRGEQLKPEKTRRLPPNIQAIIDAAPRVTPIA